ncbi:hypothetical protein [Methylobacterium organophilum]|uniref:Uncharacterized protein n=1 Tax=Methylobacterium organophilum TaxID=410 RepID=A0ABQ4TGD5_METOR|nr:hypothetical protein [Methylobacterium organophilum]GJE29511.1 hypothetical protein LKMONMHP_4393 [Methylobacterium organophilum]
MRIPSPYSAETRQAVEAMLRDTALTLVEIGRRTGVSPKTVSTWNSAGGWRKPKVAGRGALSPANWPESRLQAVARLYYEPRVDPKDLAEAMGVRPSSAQNLFRACGLPPRRPALRAPPPAVAPLGEEAPDARALNRALRAHVARQIAAFDAALHGQGAAVIDSARVLRDLGGLKRLLDALDADERAGGPRDTGDGADGGSDTDLTALRDDLARRLAAVLADGAAGGLPGEPAA